MTARVIPLRSAEVIEFPRGRSKSRLVEAQLRAFVEARRADAKTRGTDSAGILDEEEKLRIYERVCGGNDDGDTAA